MNRPINSKIEYHLDCLKSNYKSSGRKYAELVYDSNKQLSSHKRSGRKMSPMRSHAFREIGEEQSMGDESLQLRG